MHDEDIPGAASDADPAIEVAQLELRTALEVAEAHLSARGYGVVRLAIVLDGRLSDGDAFTAVQGSTVDDPDELAGLLLWGVTRLGRL